MSSGIHPLSAKAAEPQFVRVKKDELELRHLVAIHHPDAPKDHSFGAHDVSFHFHPRHAKLRRLLLGGQNYSGLDYSGGRPRSSVLQQQGFVVVARYNPYGPGGTWKEWTSWERSDLHNHGIGLHPNLELSGDEPFSGASEGRRLANIDIQSLRSLGVPQDGTVGSFYSMDREVVTNSQMDSVIAFYDAYNRAMINAGFAYGSGYGQYWLMVRLSQDLKNAKGQPLQGWQTYAWSYGNVASPDAAPLYQYWNSQTVDGQDVDLNHVQNPYRLAAWWPAGSPFAQTTGGTFMALTDAEQTELLTDMRLVKALIADQLNGGIPTQVWSYKPTGTSQSGNFEKIIIDGIFTRTDSANTKLDGVAAVLKTLVSSQATEQQKLDAITALEQAQAKAEAAEAESLKQVQASEATEADAITKIQAALTASGGGNVDTTALANALLPVLEKAGEESVRAFIEHLVGQVTFKADTPPVS